MNRALFATTFVVLAAIVVLFQLALVLGAPWGGIAMGGAFPGRLPPAMRVAAFVQAMLIAFFAAVVIARARLALPRWYGFARWFIWVVVVFFGVSVLLNAITPSVYERMLWLPVAILLFTCSIAVARRK